MMMMMMMIRCTYIISSPLPSPPFRRIFSQNCFVVRQRLVVRVRVGRQADKRIDRRHRGGWDGMGGREGQAGQPAIRQTHVNWIVMESRTAGVTGGCNMRARRATHSRGKQSNAFTKCAGRNTRAEKRNIIYKSKKL